MLHPKRIIQFPASERTIAHLSLEQLVEGANKGHELGWQRARQSIETVRLTGLLLNEAKKRVGHSKWLRFVREHYSFKPRAAQNYMRLGRLDAQGALEHLPELGIDGLLRLHAKQRPQAAPLRVQYEVVHEPPKPPTIIEPHFVPVPSVRYAAPVEPAQRQAQHFIERQERVSPVAHVARLRAALELLRGEVMSPEELWAAAGPGGLGELDPVLDFVQRLMAAQPNAQ